MNHDYGIIHNVIRSISLWAPESIGWDGFKDMDKWNLYFFTPYIYGIYSSEKKS